MSRRSAATVRAQPVAGATSVSGEFRIAGETFTVETTSRIEVVDLTERVIALVKSLGVREGLVGLASLHTTSTVFINEYQPALAADIRTFLEHVVPRDTAWLHNDPAHSDCDRMNADAHLRALLLGHGLSLQITGGELVLGQWQRILLAELDGPRTRTLRLQVMGIG